MLIFPTIDQRSHLQLRDIAYAGSDTEIIKIVGASLKQISNNRPPFQFSIERCCLNAGSDTEIVAMVGAS